MITTLPTRPLGRSGLPAITRVGFGAWAIGGGGWAFGWGPQDDDDSIAAMRHALERGINWIDTAAVYGLGHSEEVVGALLRELPPAERPLVFTKCGMVWDERDRDGGRARRARARVDPARVRGVAAPARRRADRPVPVPLARRDRHAGRGVVGRRWLELVEEGKVRAAASRTSTSTLLEPLRARSATSTRCSRRSR